MADIYTLRKVDAILQDHEQAQDAMVNLLVQAGAQADRNDSLWNQAGDTLADENELNLAAASMSSDAQARVAAAVPSLVKVLTIAAVGDRRGVDENDQIVPITDPTAVRVETNHEAYLRLVNTVLAVQPVAAIPNYGRKVS